MKQRNTYKGELATLDTSNHLAKLPYNQQLSTKKVEEEEFAPLPSFPDIIIALHLLDSNPSAPRCHWWIFVKDPESRQGTKFHATDSRGYWEYHEAKFSLIESMSVTVAAVVGTIEDHDVAKVAAILSEIPLELPAADKEKKSKFSCHGGLGNK